jgi:hypothetical protein
MQSPQYGTIGEGSHPAIGRPVVTGRKRALDLGVMGANDNMLVALFSQSSGLAGR